MKTIKFDWRDILDLTFRIYVFVFLTTYALGKLTGGQFYTPETIPDEVAQLTLANANNFELGWTFMGRSYGYILFIGISQLIGSTMLLFRKTKLIGAAILVPILVNIIVFDIFFLDNYGALASACIYFSMLMGLFLLNKTQIENAVKSILIMGTRSKLISKKGLIRLGLSLLMFGIIFFFDQLIVNALGH